MTKPAFDLSRWRESNSHGTPYESVLLPKVIAVAGEGVEPSDYEFMRLVSHRCSIPASSFSAFGRSRTCLAGSVDQCLFR